MLTSSANRTKRALSTLTEELASGITSNVSARLGGDYVYLADIDHRLAKLNGINTAAAEAKLVATGMQTSLEHMYESTQTMIGAAMSASQSTAGPSLPHLAHSAEQQLDAVITMLNTSVGGRSLFAGTATDQRSVQDTDTLLTALRTELAGATTAADVIAAAQAWFDDPAGYDTVFYGGSATSVSPLRVGEGQEVTLDFRADNDTFKDMLRNLAVGALIDDPTLGLAPSVQSELIDAAALELLSVSDGLTGMRADVGFAEQRIEEAQSRNGAASSAFQQARTELLEADPIDIATQLEIVQFQLEALFSVAARSSRLKLVNFL